MDFPWTVLLETKEGNVEAQNVLAPANPEDAISKMKDVFRGLRVLGVVKGSHANIVYGHQVEWKAPNKDQLSIPFAQGGHKN